jgi:hypothetical protein
MEHGFKRDPDTWQAFPARKRKIFAIFGKTDTDRWSVQCLAPFGVIVEFAEIR